ncbi:MAG: hypothetical protein K6G25_13905 [Bacteroidales bacterium]|nr:hypothetical protein [Bacteroidales bacterium]
MIKITCLLTMSKLPPQERHLEFYKVMCTSIDDELIFNCNTVNPFCQLNTE